MGTSLNSSMGEKGGGRKACWRLSRGKKERSVCRDVKGPLMCFFPPSYLGWLCGFARRVDPVLRRGREKGVLRTSPKRVPEEDARRLGNIGRLATKAEWGRSNVYIVRLSPRPSLQTKRSRLTRCWLGVGSAKNPIKNFKTLSLAGSHPPTAAGCGRKRGVERSLGAPTKRDRELEGDLNFEREREGKVYDTRGAKWEESRLAPWLGTYRMIE